MNKVSLRLYTEDDFGFLHEMLSDKQTARFFPYLYTSSKEQSELRLKTRLEDQKWGYDSRFVIKDDVTGKPVGEVSGSMASDKPGTMKLAVVIHPKYRGQGYATAGTMKFMEYVAQNKPNVKRFRLEIADTNDASIKVASKLEFGFERYDGDNLQYWEKDV